MTQPSQPGSLALWKERSDSLLVLQPFMDSIIVGGEGCYLIDADGRRILDLAAGQFCSILGHSHPRFTERLAQQARKLVHLGDQFVSPEVLEATARLTSVAPSNLRKAVLLSTGSEANECAMRMAKAVTGRTGMLGFTRGYYGISLATHNLSSISDHPGKVDFQPAPANQHKLLTPHCLRCPVGQAGPSCTLACLDASLELIGSQIENIAAVIVEPVVSAGGMIFPSTEYLTRLRELSRQHGFLFIVDEAQTGFGRCGRWFDIQNHGIEPDIMVVSKTAGNGYPAAAVIVSADVAQRLESRFFTHLSSHQNDPLAAAAVLAVIDTVEQEDLLARSRAMGERFMAGFAAMRARRRSIVDVRGRGLMIGIELEPGAPGSGDVAFKVALLCEARGVHLTFTYHEPVLRLIPPLVIAPEDVDLALQVIDDALAAHEAGADLMDLLPRNVRSGPFVKGMLRTSPAAFVRKLWNTSPHQWLGKLRSMR